MEENVKEQSLNNDNAPKLAKISNENIFFLKSVGKWAKNFSKLFFIGVAILAFRILYFWLFNLRGSGLSDSNFSNGFINLLFALGVFFLGMHLYNFGKLARSVQASGSEDDLNNMFKNLGNYFRLYGIITVIVLIFYLVFLLKWFILNGAIQ